MELTSEIFMVIFTTLNNARPAKNQAIFVFEWSSSGALYLF